MTRLEVDSKRVEPGDRVYVQYLSGVVRSGVFLGVRDLPTDGTRAGVCLTYDSAANMVDWIDLAYVVELAVTIPRALVESSLRELGKRPDPPGGVA